MKVPKMVRYRIMHVAPIDPDCGIHEVDEIDIAHTIADISIKTAMLYSEHPGEWEQVHNSS
jgi:hypothetical protein